jgi:hypothetical protein
MVARASVLAVLLIFQEDFELDEVGVKEANQDKMKRGVREKCQ